MQDEELIFEMLAEILKTASSDALVETLEAVAASLGVHKIKGMPVQEYYNRRKEAIAEHLVADLADSQPAQASAIKAAWDQLCAERDSQQGDDEG